MGKKNKFKQQGEGDGKPQQQNAPQTSRDATQAGQSGSGGQQQQAGQGQQQRGQAASGPQQPGKQGGPQQRPQQGGQQGTAQGAWGGGQQQRGPGPQQDGQQQRGPGPQQGGQQQRGPGPQQGGQQQRGPGPQQGGQGPAQGAWGAGQQQRGPGPQQGGQQQRGPGPQQGGQGPAQGAWSGGQQQRGPGPQQGGQQQRGPGPQQGGQGPAQGTWSGGQQQRGPGPQQGGQQQRGPGPQQGGQQQRGPGPQAGGQGSAQGQWGQQQRPPQQGEQSQQQRGPGPQQGGQQQRGPGPQQGGQQQRGPGPQQGGQQQRGPGPQPGGQQRLQQSFQNLSVSEENVLPVKPKSCAGVVRGTLGRPGAVEVNYLRLFLDKMPNEAYHYDVTITPDRPKKFLRPAFEQCVREAFGGIEAAYDGKKSCYTPVRLPGPIIYTVQVPDSGNRMKEFKVEIKETNDCVVDLNSLRTYHNDKVSDKPMRALQALDVILSATNHERGIRVGRSFFCKPSNPFDLEDGYEAWTGLFQAAILGEQPFLNVDISHKSFPRECTLLDYLYNQRIPLDQPLGNYEYRDVERYLRGIDIVYKPPASFGSFDKKYKVLGIGDPASRLKFKNDDGAEMTVAAYFASKGYQLKYPNLNCLKVGSTVRSISLPMELCSIAEGQALNRKDESKQVQKMIRFAATSTNRRKEKIMDMLQYFEHNASRIVQSFGIQIGSSFIKVPIRILPTPFMEYLNGQTVTTNRGAWRMDRQKFLDCSKPQGGSGHKWGIIYEDNPRSRLSFKDLDQFKNKVLTTSKELNMNLENNAEIKKYQNIQATLRELANQKYALVFVVLGRNAYAQIKQNAELEVGILTQCIKEATVSRAGRDPTVFSNILLKVNGKLNGTNHKISLDRDNNMKKLMTPISNVMYMGADVTHPSPDQRHIPSVVGVTASHDPFGACYNMQYRLQTSTREDIEDMESIATRHLQVYFQYMKKFPSQIIYYRDGVSDGQFPIITNVELKAIKRACAKLKCNPKLTCVIVVKRHHTRFFPMTRPRDDRDFNNVDPGTVVDQHITHPNEVQFFMVSHQSIQGTAKPTRYNVIMDESNFDINLLQQLTYNLCHLFPRCNRVVSYPAPAYLAHLVAFRGRVYLEGARTFAKDLKREYEKRLIKPAFMECNPMYFI
ncbi:protein argonaute-2-like isoform X3 [Musca autumnalis]|uniref:protein argonaute-2-like isoform X3 n=1 Tax=Musca autumnalis TaxID=221902 RepID=UPI003CF714F4